MMVVLAAMLVPRWGRLFRKWLVAIPGIAIAIVVLVVGSAVVVLAFLVLGELQN